MIIFRFILTNLDEIINIKVVRALLKAKPTYQLKQV